jgi:hypothetical protein
LLAQCTLTIMILTLRFAVRSWEMMNSDPLDGSTQSGKLVLDIRKRKGLKPDVQPLGDYEDKL